jgi:hypothetical protein
VLVAHGNHLSQHLSHVPIVLHEPLQHFTRLHEVIIVILNGLQLTDMADTADGRAPDTTHALSHDVYGFKNGLTLLVEEQVIIAEVRTGEVPVEVLRLDIERDASAMKGLTASVTACASCGVRSVSVANDAGAGNDMSCVFVF